MAKLEREAIGPMIHTAAEEVFTTMLGMEVTAGAPYVSTGDSTRCDGITSFVGLAGTHVGNGCIICSPTFARQMAAGLLMSEFDAVDDEVLDAVAEVTNMIIGNVKTHLEELVGPMGMSVPTVIYGRNFTRRTAGSTDWVTVPFQSGEERFEVQVFLVDHKGPVGIRHGFIVPITASV